MTSSTSSSEARPAVTSFLLRCAIFAALLVSVLQLVELAVPFYWGNSGFATKMAYLKESELRYDTLLVGSSRIFRQADPSIFDAASRLVHLRSRCGMPTSPK